MMDFVHMHSLPMAAALGYYGAKHDFLSEAVIFMLLSGLIFVFFYFLSHTTKDSDN